MRNLLIGVIVGLLGFFAYGKYRDSVARRQQEAAAQARRAAQPGPAASYRTSDRSARAPSGQAPSSTNELEQPAAAAWPPTASEPPRHCDGRQHCSQMSSCDEAQWFLEHCPGMKMDGDGDGEPCERGPC